MNISTLHVKMTPSEEHFNWDEEAGWEEHFNWDEEAGWEEHFNWDEEAGWEEQSSPTFDLQLCVSSVVHG